MLRVTADTNIFISSLVFPGGKPFQLLQLARAGKINLTVSEAIRNEIGGVLARKFGWQPDDIAEARKWITGIARTATPAVQLNVNFSGGSRLTRLCHPNSKQFDEFIDCEVSVPNDSSQQRLFNGASGMYRYDCSRHGVGMNEHQVAPFLPILDEPRMFECPDYFAGG